MRALLALLLAALLAPPVHAFEWSGALVVLGRDLQDTNPQRRLEALQKLADFDPVATKPYLLPLLSDLDEGVRIEAARVLARHHVVEAIAPVSEWLASQDKPIRVAAAEVLGEIGAPEAIPALTRVLGDPEPDVRRAAVEALGRIGGPQVVVPIIGRLDDDGPDVRRQAAEKLMDLADPRAVIPLVERFSDSRKEVRMSAIRAVGRLGDARAVPALVRLLRDPMEEVRIAAAEALGNLHATAATPDLIPLFYRGSDELRVKVAYALGQIRDPRAVQSLVRALGNDALRTAAREALQAVGPDAVEPLIACLTSAGGSSDGCDPTAAIGVLGVLADQRATPALVAELGRGRVKHQVVVAALGALADPRALVPLLALLDDPDPELRAAALDAIKPIADGRAADVLLHALDDHSAEVRRRAAALLGNLHVASALPRLVQLATADRSTDVVAAAVAALGDAGDPRAVAPLLTLLGEGKETVQRDAALALARLKDPHSVPGLVALARDESSTARVEAVGALGGVLRGQHDADVRDLLEELARRGAPPLALAAIDALAALGDPESIPALLAIADGQSHELRGAALGVLGDFGDGPRVETALRAALNDDDDAIRAAAAWSLGKVGGSGSAAVAAAAALISASHHRGRATAINAAAGLARRPDPGQLADVQVLAAHQDPYVRRNAALALAGMGTPEATAALHALADGDRDPRVRKFAARLLKADGAPASPRTDWIRITTGDEGGQPLRHEPYVIVFADGLVKAGYTDVRGNVGEEHVARGEADFEFLEK